MRTTRVQPCRGFTLIELMIAVALVALIASVAYPAYTGSVLKSRRAEARAALVDLMQQQERFLTQSGSYMTFNAGASGNNGTINPALSGQAIPFKTQTGNNVPSYLLGAQACAGSPAPPLNACVMLVAVPQAADNDAGNLTLTSTGARGCSGGKPSVCWP